MKYFGVKSLYKYKKIDKKFIEVLKSKSIYVPVIEQLNDPFENSIYLSTSEYDQKVYFELLNEIKKISNIDIKNNSINYLNKLLMNKEININDIEMLKSKKEKLFRNLAKKVGVVSFSSENDSLLLWSHYADSHRGICIEFDRNENNILGDDKSCFPVQYSSFIKDIEISNNDIIYSEYFRYKCDIWDYEKEWRLLTPEGRTIIKLPGEIKKVYFGLETSDENIKDIIKILGYSIKYYKAKKVDNQYKIRFSEIE